MGDYSFIANPQTPNGLAPISQMLDFAGKSQALQHGNIHLQKSGLELKKARELYSTDVERAKAESASAVTESKSRQFALTRDIAGTVLNELSGLFANPAVMKGDTGPTIEALVAARKRAIAKGVPEAEAEALTSELIAEARKPGAVVQRLRDIAQANAGAGQQAAVINTPLAPVSTGGNIQFQQLQPGAPGAVSQGQQIPTTLSPGALETVETDATGNKHIVSRSPQGAVLSTRPMPGAQVPGGGSQPFTHFAPGQAQDMPIVTTLRHTINQAAAQVPTQRFNNQQIIALAPESFTGTGADKWARVFSAFDPNWNIREKSEAANHQRLAHFMALQTQANAQAMGAGTDQARALAEQAAGSTNWTREAIISTAKVNDAFAAGLEKFNQGMEKAIQQAGGNILAVRDFQNKWAQSFDPDVYRFANALKANDTAEINKILGKTKDGKQTPQSIAKARELAQKSQMLNQLSGQ